MKIVILLFLGILAFGCSEQVSESRTRVQNLEDFEAAWNRVNKVYPFFEYKNIDWNSIYSSYRPRVKGADNNGFITVLHDLLAELKDGHVYYKTLEGKWVIPYRAARRLNAYEEFSLDLVKSYFKKDLKVTKKGGAHYGILQNKVGYIYLYSMKHTDIAEEFSGILEFFKNTQGLIIDIRTGKGGDIQNVKAVVSRFIDAPLQFPNYYFLGEHYPLDPIQPSTPKYKNPVVVITNALTFSAGESTTMLLKRLPHVTVVGDITGGGGGTASAHSRETLGNYKLPSGIIINIPTGYGLRYDGEHVEWKGVIPDIRVMQTKMDIQNGHDKQLERAIDLLL